MKFSILKYLKQSFKHPTKTGSIAPSCEQLSHLITEVAELHNANTVLEFGSGTGVFTEMILDKISDEANFFVFEINPQFAEATKSRCPDAIVYNDSAENAREHLETHGIESCDCIISGLPWAVFDSNLQDRLLRTVWDILKPGGMLLTMAYVHASISPTAIRFKNRLYYKFSSVSKTKTIWSNLPPAFVYCAQK